MNDRRYAGLELVVCETRTERDWDRQSLQLRMLFVKGFNATTMLRPIPAIPFAPNVEQSFFEVSLSRGEQIESVISKLRNLCRDLEEKAFQGRHNNPERKTEVKDETESTISICGDEGKGG
jgi:hypothetical protein